MNPPELARILELGVAERVRVAQEIWDSIAADPAAVDVTESQREELDRRLAADAELGGDSWEAVKSRVRTRR